MTQITRLKRLSRMSHFMLNSPSVTLRSGSIYFSASAVEEMEIHKYKSCYISIKDNVSPSEATEIYAEFNNDQESVQNAPVKMGLKQIGASVTQLGTVLNQLVHAKALVKQSRKERRRFLKKDPTNNKWFFTVAPRPYLKTRDFSKMGEFSALYYLCHNGQINRIGESSNLKKRLSDYKRQEIPFDEVHYCRMDSFSDNERKNWETHLINQYVNEKGMLPPYNFQNGRQIN